MPRFTPLKKISSWRRIASSMWKPHNSPQVLGMDDLDMTELTKLVKEARELTGEHITLTHMMVKVTAEILRRYPNLNVLIVRGQPMQRTTVDVFVQVAVPGKAKGNADLSGIKIANADQKSVLEIAREINGRADKVRQGQDKEIEETKRLLDIIPKALLGSMLNLIAFLTMDAELDLTGLGVKTDPFGSTMVSNVGAFDAHVGFAPLIPVARTPIIILMGAVKDRPWVHEGEIKIRKVMCCGATFDHRLLDGYQIGLYSRNFKNMLEDATWLRENLT